jgi:hypothetical protein
LDGAKRQSSLISPSYGFFYTISNFYCDIARLGFLLRGKKKPTLSCWFFMNNLNKVGVAVFELPLK